MNATRLTHPVFASLDHPLSRKRERGQNAEVHPLSAEGEERVVERSKDRVSQRSVNPALAIVGDTGPVTKAYAV